MKFQSAIKIELEKFDKAFPEAFSSKVALLDLILRYAVKQKGKRIRPSLVLLIAKALAGNVNERTYRGATLVELMHTATLVHDDVVDESFIRRSIFSINALWKNKIAVLIGDYMLSRVLLLAVEHGDHDLLGLVSQSVREMSEGELLQIEKARKLDIDEKIYLEIISKKTASLISACCAIGASSVNANALQVKMATKFGLALGMAFQIQDDLLDYNNFGKSGKPAGIDVKEQKMTLPLIYALKVASNKDKRKMMQIVRNKKDDLKSISWLMSKVLELGGQDYAKSSMMKYEDEAIFHLNKFPGSESKEALRKLVFFVVKREL
ncbi:MAG: Octaprenyl diphosphate synthase [Owenweeksia sp. TMED14]|nr:MAG: Octaprenyl diphosphate synthase [Owenweeksia sp. TMED14]|tara:strand:+ start:7792 stop:8757 length:966 start_codon:yes stop_codon:yes gene_type:complete